MWITKKPWCDYMAVKLDHLNPEKNAENAPFLLRRVYYSRDFVMNWMLPRIFYFSKCLMNNEKPPNLLYRNIKVCKPPKVKIENLLF